MTDKLIDTNIIVYAYDTSEKEKHNISKDILKEVWEKGGGIVCLQNLMEFFVIITKKVENPISIIEAKTIIEDFLKSENWKIIDRDEDTFLKAIDLVSKYKIHLWDAMIVACMTENDINEIITENKKD
ncbi:MAG: PIN domain-containing protein, partial [bacterium]